MAQSGAFGWGAATAGQRRGRATRRAAARRGRIVGADKWHSHPAAVGRLHRLLLKAAKSFEPLDVGLASPNLSRSVLRGAVTPAGSAPGAGLREAAHSRAGGIRVRPDPPSAPDLLLDGLALLNTEGYTGAAPTLSGRSAPFPASRFHGGSTALRRAWLAHRRAALGRRELGPAHDPICFASPGETGALGVLPIALNHNAPDCMYAKATSPLPLRFSKRLARSPRRRAAGSRSTHR